MRNVYLLALRTFSYSFVTFVANFFKVLQNLEMHFIELRDDQ
jgi:hypothetical protein